MIAISNNQTLDLFDQDYYAHAANRRFQNAGQAFRHYTEIGEHRGLNPSRYFDVAGYRRQMKNTSIIAEHSLSHYLQQGFRNGFNPTPYFDQTWYGWQNPDYRDTHPNPYIHYLANGRFQGHDPSPFVDMVQYTRSIGSSMPLERSYEMILGGLRAPAIGVYSSWQDLYAAQTRFRSTINLFALKNRLNRLPRQALVFLQCGPQSRHKEWLTEKNRNWDLLVNYYDYRGYDPGIGDYVFFQPGTKFTAISNLWKKFRNLLEQYDHILFLDDDILVDVSSLNRLFGICRAENLDLAQMALSKTSHCVWDVFFQRRGKRYRNVNAVEIMMPVVSRSTLRRCAQYFDLSISGFGLDLLMGQEMRNVANNNIRVIDEITAEHAKPIDDASGGYYSYLRANHINPKAELWDLITRYGIENEMREID